MSRTGGRDLKEALLEEARALLVREGYTQLSMRRIASAVGCTATSIYLHFESKDALIHALIEEGMARLHEELSSVATSTDPRVRLEQLGRGYIDFGCANPEYYEIMFSLHPKWMERFPADKYRRSRRNLELFADSLKAIPGGAASAPDLLTAATLVWSSLHGTVSLFIAQRIDARIDRAQLVDAAVRHACRWIDALPDVADAS